LQNYNKLLKDTLLNHLWNNSVTKRENDSYWY